LNNGAVLYFGVEAIERMRARATINFTMDDLQAKRCETKMFEVI
jgi:hypothetical protein